jgi:hypothetical protein
MTLFELGPGSCLSSAIGGLSSSNPERDTDICDLPERDDTFRRTVLRRLIDCEPFVPSEAIKYKDPGWFTVLVSALAGKYSLKRSLTAGKQTQMIDRETSIMDKIAIP